MPLITVNSISSSTEQNYLLVRLLQCKLCTAVIIAIGLLHKAYYIVCADSYYLRPNFSFTLMISLRVYNGNGKLYPMS